MIRPSRVALNKRTSWRCAPSTTNARGIPAPSVKRLRLVPRLPRSVGLAIASGAGERGFGHHAIHRLPQSCEEARSFPGLKAIMHRRTRSHFSWQGIPLDARSQHVHDGCKGFAIFHSPSSSLGMRRCWGDQRANPLPYLITDFPRFSACH
jgi:hypothetical protein